MLFSRTQLAERASELAEELSADLSGAGTPPILIGVLKGSAIFLADLIRSMKIDVAVDLMAISSYSSARTAQVRIVKDIDDISDRDVVIVEDIVDTGLTLTYLRRTLEERGPRSLRALTLLDKAARRIVPVPLEYRGFEIPDVFVVGYGMDFQGRYRNVADLYAVRDLPRFANDPAMLVPEVFGRST